jgi:hypothetical protein
LEEEENMQFYVDLSHRGLGSIRGGGWVKKNNNKKSKKVFYF